MYDKNTTAGNPNEDWKKLLEELNKNYKRVCTGCGRPYDVCPDCGRPYRHDYLPDDRWYQPYRVIC